MASSFAQNNRSLWIATGGGCPDSRPFPDGRTFDVAVIGAGVAGATAALSLVEQGCDVALLEASTAGSGATGRSGGFIVPSFSAVSPETIISERGESGERLVRLVAGAADVVFSLIRDNALDCDADQNGWFHPARTVKALQRLTRDANVWKAAGAAGELHDAAETARLTGVEGYVGCWEARSGGTLHPVKFVNGLLRCALGKGLHFTSGTAATSLVKTGRGWNVETRSGTLGADTILICTNARSPGLSPQLQRSIVPLQVCQLATKPIAARERTGLLRQGQSLTDTRVNLFSYRFDRQWRLITGAIPVLPFGDGQRLARLLARRLQRELSLSATPEPEFVWSGNASITSDFLPHVYDLSPGLYAVTACNGRGLALSTALARKLAQALTSRRFDDLPVSLQRPEPMKGRGAKSLATRLYPLYGFLRDRLGI